MRKSSSLQNRRIKTEMVEEFIQLKSNFYENKNKKEKK